MHLTEFMRTLHSVDSRYRSANSKIPPISLDISACFHIYATAFRPYPRYVTIVLILESIGGNSSTRYSDSLVIKHGNSSPPSLPGCLRGLTSHAIYGTVCKQLTLASVTYSSHCTVLFFCQTQGICEARVRRDSEVNLIGDIQASYGRKTLWQMSVSDSQYEDGHFGRVLPDKPSLDHLSEADKRSSSGPSFHRRSSQRCMLSGMKFVGE